MAETTIRNLGGLPGISQEERIRLGPVLEQFEFRVSPYYAKLIDWSDRTDPLRRMVLPSEEELASDLDFDASAEAENIRVHGVQHKYAPTVLLLVTDVCAAYCRFCFRKRFTLATSTDQHLAPPEGLEDHEKETTLDISPGLAYIAEHPEVTNVLLTGGDPLILSPRRLEGILAALREIPHVRTIRLGSKIPAFDPGRITPALIDVLARHALPNGKIYIMTHFTHSREITPLSVSKLTEMLRAGLVLNNQAPLLRGINDDPGEIARLFGSLADCGVTPYYLFHCRPTFGNDAFMLTIQEGLKIVSEARRGLSGLAKRFRYVASHASGKIEIVGEMQGELVLKYHEARSPEDEARLFTWPADQPIYWPEETAEPGTPPSCRPASPGSLKGQASL